MISTKKNIIRLYALLRREYGRYTGGIIVVAFLSFVSSILEGIGINSIIPLFSFASGSPTKGDDFVSQFIENIFNFFGVTYTLKYLLIFIALLFLIKALFIYVTTWLAARLNTAYERDTRLELLAHTLHARWPFVSSQKIGHLEQILTTDVNYSSNLLFYITNGLLILANLTIYFLISFNISPPIALITLLVGLIVFFVFKPFFSKNRRMSAGVEKVYKELSHFINQHVLGMKTIKSLALEQPVIVRGKIFFEKIREANLGITAVRNLTNALLQPIGLLFILGIFGYFYKMTAFSFASFAVVVYSINKIFNFVQQAQAQIHGISALSPYVSSIQGYRDSVVSEQELSGGTRVVNFSRELSFKKVNFSYNTESTGLKDISFSLKKGEMLGVIGPSGAGKTTIVDLLLGLFVPTSGQIIIDGVPLSNLNLSEWRKHVGYVSQDMFLLNDTVENNIRFYSQDITDLEVREAASLANTTTFIENLPRGFETMVGERGILFSGGERQRIILARVLARHPDILILDEATSSLDNESEALIQKAIEDLRSKITVIVIAHRLSTVMSADRLLVIEGGRLTSVGSPETMLKDKNSYLFKVTNIHS